VTDLSRKRTAELLENLAGKRVLVIGDVMLDRYLWGRVTRMSPEAPVPVVEVEREAICPGGAANVAANVLGLGARPVLIGLLGSDDDAGAALRRNLEEMSLSSEGLLADRERPTTVKTRIIAHQQHVVRADQEDRRPAAGETAERIMQAVNEALPGADAVVLQDYNKGVLSADVLAMILPLLHDSGLPVTVDPKFERFFDYRGVTVFKPNLQEVEMALSTHLEDEAGVEHAARTLQERLAAANVLITRGEKGMTLLAEDGRIDHVRTRARQVYDVSGAGDTVIATLTAMLAAGADVREATSLANFAAGVVVGEVGAVPIEAEALMAAVDDDRR